MNNARYGVVIMFVFALMGFLLEGSGFPITPIILGVIPSLARWRRPAPA
jgi:TctA family transporter